MDRPVMTNIEMQTKSATTVDGIEALDNEIDDLQTNAATPEELKRAKDSILNSFIFRVRHAGEGAGGENDLRVLSLSAGFPGTLPRGSGEGHR